MVERFWAMAWYNSIACVMNEDSPTVLERLIQRGNIKKNQDGKWVYPGSWEEYKTGRRLPKDTRRLDGNLGPIEAAAIFVPESLDLYRHPLWEIMRSDRLDLGEAAGYIERLKPAVARYYLDLSDEVRASSPETFTEDFAMPIWIDRGDYRGAIDHLAANLAFLRLDIIRDLRNWRRSISRNIAKTLGPISESPWIGPFHEEMFDWMEREIWKDSFDQIDLPNDDVKGWRSTRQDWLLVEN